MPEPTPQTNGASAPATPPPNAVAPEAAPAATDAAATRCRTPRKGASTPSSARAR